VENIHLEHQIFTWEGWDDFGVMSPTFYNVTLVVPIGPFPVGHKFASAIIDGEKSTITFVDEKETNLSFDLKMSVGSFIVGNTEDGLLIGSIE
jgi:hypothetical protein